MRHALACRFFSALESCRFRTPGSAAQRPFAHFFEAGRKQYLFHRPLHILPYLLQPAAFSLYAHAAHGFVMHAAGLGKSPVDDSQHCPHGNLSRRPRQRIASAHASPALQNATALQFQQDLFKILQRNMVPLRDFVDGHDIGILQAQVQHRLCGVFAFCCHSHLILVTWFSLSHARRSVNLPSPVPLCLPPCV